jgi:outer membrane protein
MKLLAPALILGLAVGGSAETLSAQANRAPDARIAVVNTQRLTTETADGKAGLAKIQSLQQQKTTELRAKQQALEATRQQIAKTTDSAALAQLQRQEVQERADFERAAAQAQADIQNLQRQLNADLQGKLKAVVADLMKSGDIQLVLPSEAVIWAAPGVDMTDAVLTRLNATPSSTDTK